MRLTPAAEWNTANEALAEMLTAVTVEQIKMARANEKIRSSET